MFWTLISSGYAAASASRSARVSVGSWYFVKNWVLKPATCGGRSSPSHSETGKVSVLASAPPAVAAVATRSWMSPAARLA